MTKEYKLTTIKDIFEQVPADRIKDCMAEISVMLVQAKEFYELLCTVNELITHEGTPEIKIPDKFTWRDDGNGEVISNFVSSDKKVEIKLKTTSGNNI